MEEGEVVSEQDMHDLIGVLIGFGTVLALLTVAAIGLWLLLVIRDLVRKLDR